MINNYNNKMVKKIEKKSIIEVEAEYIKEKLKDKPRYGQIILGIKEGKINGCKVISEEDREEIRGIYG